MTTILLVIHVLLAIALVITILLQRSEGGALGIGGGGGGAGGMMSSRGQANLLTRTTAVLATLFIVTSMTLAILASRSSEPTSVLDAAPTAPVQQPSPGQLPPGGGTAPAGEPGGQPAPAPEPAQPSAPLGR